MRNIICESKRQYSSGQAAEVAAEDYNSDIALVEYVMVPYHCSVHSCWHVGHDRYASESVQNAYSVACHVRHKNRTRILLKI